MTNELLYEITDGVGRITFNRPDQRNALTYGMYEGLAEICANAPTDGSVKAIIVSGAGDRAFAAGTDMTQFRAFAEPQDALDYEAKMDRVLEAVERCPIPTIAAITGACTGGGAAIAAACDLRISDARLKFGFPIARTLGNCLSINNLNRLSVLLGPGRMREILFTARLIEAEEAQQIGLVSEVLADAADLRRRADELAALVADHAPLTLRATKEGLRRLRVEGPGADGSDLIVGAYMSADFKEGMEAFLGKRKPTWTGK
ncbi:MAG: enoyl-CoA hydratase/isomerase family protein [Pseudomonadota bacterium]